MSPVSPELQERAVAVTTTRSVDVEKIEGALSSMWSEAGESGGKEQSAGVTRACTVNLVVCTTPAEDRDQLSDLLAEVNHDHPGRTLLMVANRKATQPRIEAYVSMRCQLAGGGRSQVCGEEVTIEADGPLVDHAASAIEALLVPGLPVYLWWKSTPSESDLLFDRLTRMVDRVVIDSAKFDRPADDLLRLARLIRARKPALRVSDLNWGRLTAWFTLLASLWDVPDYRPVLDRIDRMVIAYRPLATDTGAIPPRPFLLAGWIASRLGWEVVGAVAHDSSEGASWRLRAGERGITLSIRRETSSVPADARIDSIELCMSDGTGAFVAALAPDNSRITTDARLGTTRSLARVLAYTSRSDADRLSGELAILSHDAVYEAAMVSAGQLIALLPRSGH